MPVQTQAVFGRRRGPITDNLMQHRTEEALFERFWGRAMRPHRAPGLPQAEELLALLLTQWDVTLLQGRQARLSVLSPCQRFVPALLSLPRAQTVFGGGRVILPAGPPGFIARFIQR